MVKTKDKDNKEVLADDQDHNINFVNETIPVGDSCGKCTILLSLYFHPCCMYLFSLSLLQIDRSAELLTSFPGSDMNSVIMTF
jgi:hypothetical protein